MKKLLIFMMISMGLGLSSCKEESPDPGYLAGIAAKGYYDLLLEGSMRSMWLVSTNLTVFRKDITSSWCSMQKCMWSSSRKSMQA